MFRISLINLCQKNIKSSYNIGRQVLFLNRFNSTMSTKIGRASCRGKRVDLGGRRIIKKKKKKNESGEAPERIHTEKRKMQPKIQGVKQGRLPSTLCSSTHRQRRRPSVAARDIQTLRCAA